MNALDVFINEVKRQLNRKVKVVRSYKGGEYYGNFNKSGQCPGSFAKFLQSRNRTLMEMVRSMLNHSTVPLSLWIYALKTVVYLRFLVRQFLRLLMNCGLEGILA